MINVFLDTNILLDFYHLSGPDLDELQKIVELMGAGRLKLYAPKQVEDEFWRNREGVISDALKQFDETKAVSRIPNIVRGRKEVECLSNAIDEVNKQAKDLKRMVESDINNNELKADSVIARLFGRAKTETVENEIVKRAKLRVALENPPGKKGSLGDAICWEWLLENVADEENLTLVSSDGDYESVLTKGSIKDYLKREWEEKNGGEIELHKNLPSFLGKYFPEIKLSGEVRKLTAIEDLEGSSSFSATHSAISKLSRVNDFSSQEIIKILQAFTSNDQVYGIIGDRDVLEFAKKVVEYAPEEAVDLAVKVKEMIEAVENRNNQ